MSGGKGSTAVTGLIISALVVACVAGIGFFQYRYAPGLYLTTSTSSTSASTGFVLNITIPNGAGSPPPGYTSGAKTQYGFSPEVVTVVIGVNNTVRWVNDDSAPHTATSDATGVFDTGIIAAGDSSSPVTLATQGTYAYHCSLHSWMQATIIVKA